MEGIQKFEDGSYEFRIMYIPIECPDAYDGVSFFVMDIPIINII